MTMDDTSPGAAPTGRRETSVRTSLQELKVLEERRLQDEEAADQASREANRLARAEAERHEREAAAERARQEEAEAEARRKADAAAAERVRLLDVDRRIANRERELRQEFALERAQLEAERGRPSGGASRWALIIAILITLGSLAGTFVLERRL